MIVDIIVPVGNRGGVENIINMLIPFAEEKFHWTVRIVQLVGNGEVWLPDNVEHVVLNQGLDTYNLGVFATQYVNYVLDRGCPDIILASVWPMTSYIAKLALTAMKKDGAIPIVAWGHAPVDIYKQGGFGDFSHLMMADVQLSISEYIYNEIVNNLPDNNVLPVKNPVVIPGEECMVNYSKDDLSGSDRHNLLFVGRISTEKDLETAIRAIAEVDNWTLTIVGTGKEAYVEEIKQLVEAHNVKERVIFYGWQSEPWNYAKKGDWFVLPSIYEGFALVTIESLVRGIPVIGTPVGVNLEVIVPGKTGYLFEKMNHTQLAEILLCIDKGVLPCVEPYDCREVAQKYDVDKALMDFCAKVEEISIRNVDGVKDKFAKAYLYEDDKISVVLVFDNDDRSMTRECMNSLLEQSNLLEFLELIIINSSQSEEVTSLLYEYEAEYSDNIILLNSSEGDKRQLIESSLEYIGGDYIIYIDDAVGIGKTVLDRMYRRIKLYDYRHVKYCNIESGKKYIMYSRDFLQNEAEDLVECMLTSVECADGFINS